MRPLRLGYNSARQRHDITPDEAEQAILNGFVEIEFHVINDEDRWLIVGVSEAGRFLTIVWTVRNEAIRVITGWDSTRQEEAVYWAEKGA